MKKLLLTVLGATLASSVFAYAPSNTLSIGDGSSIRQEMTFDCPGVSVSPIKISDSSVGYWLNQAAGIFSESALKEAAKTGSPVSCNISITGFIMPAKINPVPRAKTVKLGQIVLHITESKTGELMQTADISGVRPLTAADGLIDQDNDNKPLTGNIHYDSNGISGFYFQDSDK